MTNTIISNYQLRQAQMQQAQQQMQAQMMQQSYTLTVAQMMMALPNLTLDQLQSIYDTAKGLLKDKYIERLAGIENEEE